MSSSKRTKTLDAMPWAMNHSDDTLEAVPSRYIKQLNQKVHRIKAVAYGRVSGWIQEAHKNLEHQLNGTVISLKEMGIETVSCAGEVCSGSGTRDIDRLALTSQLKAAGKLGLPLVIPCTSRLLRNVDFHTKNNSNTRPTTKQFFRIMALAWKCGVKKIYTLANPDDSPKKDLGFLSRLNRLSRGTLNAGRPTKVCRERYTGQRDRWAPLALELRLAGNSYRTVAVEISKKADFPVSCMAVHRWLTRGQEDPSMVPKRAGKRGSVSNSLGQKQGTKKTVSESGFGKKLVECG